jgi:AcrR family transcriptional regulator
MPTTGRYVNRKKMATQEERRQVTRAAIIAAARRLFGSRSYAQVSIDQIASEADVAKGAVYHHFATKADLFEAVLRAVSTDALASVQSGMIGQTDLLQAMQIGNRLFFDACADRATAQVMLRDGPSVLGWSRWREIDTEYFGGLVKMALSAGMSQGIIAKRPVEPLVILILGAIADAAIDCANSDDFAQAAETYLEALDAILQGLRT